MGHASSIGRSECYVGEGQIPVDGNLYPLYATYDWIDIPCAREKERHRTESQEKGSTFDKVEMYEVWAAGFNGHGQLSTKHTDDLISVRPMYEAESKPLVLFAGWSVSAILSGQKLIQLGHQAFTQDLTENTILTSGFGDSDGLIGCLDQEGHLYLVEAPADQRLQLVNQHQHGSPTLDHVAMAGNNRVVATLGQGPSEHFCDVLEFDSLESFRGWYADPSHTACVDKSHRLHGRAKQLIGSTATFVVLMEGGAVYTWGDPRHRSLARPISGGDVTPADIPGFVEGLGGLRITQIASGGWMSAALSEDGALYLWGTTTPGKDDSILCLRKAGAGNIALVDLPGDGSEPLDVLDMSIGDNHAIVLAGHDRIFVVGEHRNGQLGMGDDQEFFECWREMVDSRQVESVACGPKATFMIVQGDRRHTT